MAAAIPGACFMIDAKEDGINRLKEAGLVPATIPVLPPVTSWPDAMGMLDSLRTEPHDYRCLVLDALGGFERLMHEEVCRRDFGGEWGEQGFLSYAKGYDLSLTDWRMFINALDALRDERKMSIVLLGHARVKPFKNPEGPDYDRYMVDIHEKTWSLTHKWADMVLFLNYEVAFKAKDSAKQKAKAQGHTRMMYTEHHAAFDAKNRSNLPPEIEMGNSGAEAWQNLVTAMQSAKKGGVS